EGGGLAEATPIRVASNVAMASWSPDAEWLLFSTAPDEGVRLAAWSRREQAVRELAELTGHTSVGFTPGPGGQALVHLPAEKDANGNETVAEYRVVSALDGSSRTLVSDASYDAASWLWPEPWVQYSAPQDDAVLFDVSNLEHVVSTALGRSPLAMLSPEPGV